MPQINVLQVSYLWVAISTLNKNTMERIQIRQELHQPNQQKYRAFIMKKNDSTGGGLLPCVLPAISTRWAWWSHYAWQSPAFLGWLKSCLPTGSGRWIPCLDLLERAGFALSVKMSLSQPKFSLYSSDSLPPREASDWLCGGYLPAGVKPQYLATAASAILFNSISLLEFCCQHWMG